MRFWLRHNPCSPIGLDIGSESIRALQLRLIGRRLAVVGAARWRFPPAVAEGLSDSVTRRQLAVQAVGEMLRQGGFRGREVVSCLRVDELAIKNIRLPHMEESELAQAALWECKDRFGFEVSPDRLHCISAGEVRQGNESCDEVILLAASAEAVQRHLELLAEMGVSPRHIDAEPTALFRGYQRFLRRVEDESAVSVIVDIGLVATKVVIARGNTIVMIKSIDIAGRKFSQAVGKELGISYAEAVQVRQRAAEGRAEGDDKVQWTVTDALRAPVEALAREVALCLRYCSATFRGLRPTQVTLTGGEAYDPSLVKLLSGCLDCPCSVGEPLRGVELGEMDLGGDRRSSLTEWSVAAGLALRGLCGEGAMQKVEHETSGVPA